MFFLSNHILFQSTKYRTSDWITQPSYFFFFQFLRITETIYYSSLPWWQIPGSSDSHFFFEGGLEDCPTDWLWGFIFIFFISSILTTWLLSLSSLHPVHIYLLMVPFLRHSEDRVIHFLCQKSLYLSQFRQWSFSISFGILFSRICSIFSFKTSFFNPTEFQCGSI